MIPVQIQFVSEEAKNLYNGKLEYATEGSSGFDLRAIDFEYYSQEILEKDFSKHGCPTAGIPEDVYFLPLKDGKYIIDSSSVHILSNEEYINYINDINYRIFLNKKFLPEELYASYSMLVKTGIKVKCNTHTINNPELERSINERGGITLYTRHHASEAFMKFGVNMAELEKHYNKQYEIQIRPRSGLALKHGITVLNTPGTIDSDYNKEIGVILYNAGHESFEIKKGDRIAQAVICPVIKGDFLYVDDIEDSGRGGYGSTGVE